MFSWWAQLVVVRFTTCWLCNLAYEDILFDRKLSCSTFVAVILVADLNNFVLIYLCWLMLAVRTGKTLLAKTLARLVNVPFVMSDATSLTQVSLFCKSLLRVVLLFAWWSWLLRNCWCGYGKIFVGFKVRTVQLAYQLMLLEALYRKINH